MNFYELCKEILGEKYPKVELYRDEPGPRTIKHWIENNKDMIQGENLAPDTIALEIARL